MFNITKRRFWIALVLGLTLLGSGLVAYNLHQRSQNAWSQAPYSHLHVNTASAEYLVELKQSLEVWGLGKELQAFVSNDVDYFWYIDQANTGASSNDNCGPSCVAMAAKWANEKSTYTAKDARLAFRPLGGWWYTSDITGCLKKFDVDFFEINVANLEDILKALRTGHILIINNTMSGIAKNSETHLNANSNLRTGRFYEFSGGHFLIIKGALTVDDTYYFEVYDPNNWHMTYANGQPQGMNRYYEASQVLASIMSWNPNVVAIKKNVTVGNR